MHEYCSEKNNSHFLNKYLMKTHNTFWIILILSFTSFLLANGQDGEAIYKQNCSACHKLGQRLIGPDLIGINQKRSEEWLISFIKSSQTMIKSGDADAVSFFLICSPVFLMLSPKEGCFLRCIIFPFTVTFSCITTASVP